MAGPRIVDLLAAGPTLSFEFSPPKDDEAERRLDKTVAELADANPAFISVTYGALGSTRDRTRDAVLRLDEAHPFPAMAHLTCVGHHRADIAELLDAYAEGGVRNILALGGDPPADGSDPGGDFAHATDLIDVVRAHPAGFSVGVAAHPEKHPRSPDLTEDRRRLAEKLEAADFAITQFFFDVDFYCRLVDELAAVGCTKPVLPGVMPFVSVAGVRRMSAMNDTTIDVDLDRRLDAVDGDADATRALGVDVAVELCRGLRTAGAPGLHLYTMNRSTSTLEVLAALGGP